MSPLKVEYWIQIENYYCGHTYHPNKTKQNKKPQETNKQKRYHVTYMVSWSCGNVTRMWISWSEFESRCGTSVLWQDEYTFATLQ